MGRYTGAPTLQFAGLLLSAVPALAGRPQAPP
jgi:hypothetical protein